MFVVDFIVPTKLEVFQQTVVDSISEAEVAAHAKGVGMFVF